MNIEETIERIKEVHYNAEVRGLPDETTSAIREAITDAIIAERESCAKIAEEVEEDCLGRVGHCDGDRIIKSIRAGKYGNQQ